MVKKIMTALFLMTVGVAAGYYWFGKRPQAIRLACHVEKVDVLQTLRDERTFYEIRTDAPLEIVLKHFKDRGDLLLTGIPKKSWDEMSALERKWFLKINLSESTREELQSESDEAYRRCLNRQGIRYSELNPDFHDRIE